MCVYLFIYLFIYLFTCAHVDEYGFLLLDFLHTCIHVYINYLCLYVEACASLGVAGFSRGAGSLGDSAISETGFWSLRTSGFGA